MPHLTYLGLGGNIGDRLENLRSGLRRLAPEVRLVAVSALYESAPLGVTDQAPFLNAACAAETELSPEPLLQLLKRIERDAGRTAGPRWGPRPLDLDILLYDATQLDTPELQIPHPRLHVREFVLRPLADLAPDLAVPGDGRSVAELLRVVERQGVELLCAAGWEGARSL